MPSPHFIHRPSEIIPLPRKRIGLTEPPMPLSEAELITAMEAHGIGTDASIPSHIGTLESRRHLPN